MNISHRTAEEIREHYDLEIMLANKLLKSRKKERKGLYSSLYNELFQKIPSHPQLTRKESTEESQLYVDNQLRLLNKFIQPTSNYLEIGPGDCSLAFEVAKMVNTVYAIDVSDEITKAGETPDNFELIISDGCSIPVATGSIDVAYSNQLMEHLHPDDAQEQLINIVNALTDNGKYICITPNRLSGPHDISMYFDEVATGFHLKEYTNTELLILFKKAGFSKVETYIGGKGVYLNIPSALIKILEYCISLLPVKISKTISRASRGILQNCQIVGSK